MSKKLYVGNLPETTSERELYQMFSRFGATTAKIPLDSNGYPRGFGFVRVMDDRVGEAVKTMDGQELDGQSLTVQEARPKDAEPSSTSYETGWR